MSDNGQSETARNASSTLVLRRTVNGASSPFRSTSVSPDSRISVLRHGVERRSNTLLARDHLSQLDRKAIHEARPRRQVRLGAHAVVDGVERDAEVAGGADSD